MQRTIETDPPGAAQLVSFPLMTLGAEFAGRQLTLTTATLGGSPYTLEQVVQTYGSDVVLEQSLLWTDAFALRPGGKPIWTPIGSGYLFFDEGRAKILVPRGKLMLNVTGPTQQILEQVLSNLREAD